MSARLKLTICIALWGILIGAPLCAFLYQKPKPAILSQSTPPRLLTDAEFGIQPVSPSAADVDNPQIIPPDTENPFADIQRETYADAPPVAPPPSPLLTDKDVFGDLIPKTGANGLPAGAWASTLVADANWPNLWRDPATQKLYRLVDGKIVEETNPYFAVSPQAALAIIKSQDESADENIKRRLEENHQDAYLNQISRANDVSARIAEPSYIYAPPVVTSYNPDSLANPYGAGSPYKAGGLMNPYSRYGSPYSSQSWRNPYATDTPKLYDSQGNYRGKLSLNPYDPDSTANPYGKYGSPFSPESINNPYGAGNPYNPQPIYVFPSK